MITNNEELILIKKNELIALIITTFRNEGNRLLEEFENRKESKKKTYLTRKQAKEKTKVSYPTLWKLDKSGELPALRIGGKVLYELGQLEDFIENKKG